MKPLLEEFAKALENWLTAWRAGDDARARALAEEIKLAGDLLAIRPEFTKCFERHTPVPPRDALHGLSMFLKCVSDHRLQVRTPSEVDGFGAS